MRKLLALTLAAVFVFLTTSTVSAAQPQDRGFDEFGYNNSARVFVGTCKSWYLGKFSGTEAQAEAYCGAYANDQLVMKWNKAWDDCNDAGNNDEAACAGAWLSNEWNGAVSGGSGEVWHYKFIWVGQELENSTYWRDGGYALWGNYEAVMDQGTAGGEHFWYTHALPTGYGVK